MAQKLSKDQLSVVNRVIDVLDNIGGVNVDPVIEMAVFGCSELLRQTLAPPAKWTAAMVKEVLTTNAAAHNHRNRPTDAAHSRTRPCSRGQGGCHTQSEQGQSGRQRRKDRCRHQGTGAEQRTGRNRVITFRAADHPGLHNNAARTQAGGQVRSYRSARTACD